MEKLEHLKSEFRASINQAVGLFRKEMDMPAYLRELTEGAALLAREIAEIGDFAFERLKEHADYACYRLNFEWADAAKAFLILWRDIQLEQEKAQVMYWDGKADKKALSQLKEASWESISQVAEELLSRLEGQLAEADLQEQKQQEKQIEKWKLQHNPWPTYKEQILQIPDQCKDIQEKYDVLEEVVGAFKEIKEAVLNLVNKSIEENESFVQRSEETIQLIGESLPEEEEARPGRIAARLEDIQELMDLPNHLDELNRDVELLLDKIPEKVRIPFDMDGGLVQYKDMSLRRVASQWIEAKIMPVIFEIWEIAERERNNLKTTLLNIRNRTSVLAAELKEGKHIEVDKEDVSQPLNMFLDNAGKWKIEMQEHAETINRRLNRSFFLSTIYDSEKEFLALPFQSTIRYFAPNQNEFRQRLSSVWIRIKHFIQRVRQQVVEEESLSSSERLVNFIQSRRPEGANSNYTNIFLTKGYIGDSFWVGREKELAHLDQLVQNWEKGIRGAVVLYGQRFSGKTLLGEVVANRFFHKRTIRLQPDSVIKMEGRQLKTTHNLGEALDFIRKHSLNIRPLIWIDDLELWRDTQIPLSKNIRALQHHLDHHAEDQFFMLGMNTWLKKRLDKEHNLSNFVHSSIKLDKMELKEVLEAIWIRHSATNRTLVDEAGNEIEPLQFRKMASSLYNASKGNIGESLNRWAYAIQCKEDDKVMFEFPLRANMPDFLSPDSSLLLSTFFIMKRTNEYQLRKIFGPPFKTKYRNLLTQLMSIGLIERRLDGWLEVNELVVNDLSRMMGVRK